MRNLGRLFFATRGTFRNHYCHAKNFHKLFRLLSRMPLPPPACSAPPPLRFSARLIKTNNLESGCFPLEMSAVSRKQVFASVATTSEIVKNHRQHSDFPAVINFGRESGRKQKYLLSDEIYSGGFGDKASMTSTPRFGLQSILRKAINAHLTQKAFRGNLIAFKCFSFLSRYSISMSSWSLKPKKKTQSYYFHLLRIFVVGRVGCAQKWL